MGVFENVKATIDVNINANGEQRITGKVLNGVLQEIVSASESSSSDLQESLSSLSEKVDNIGSKDFNPSGTYPDLTAGDLAGRGESVPASFGFRASGGKSIKDGRAYIKRIKGNSVVWNQLVDTITTQDCELSENGNLLTITPQGSFPGVKNVVSMNIIENHVYICISHRIDGGYLNVNCGGYDGDTNVPFRAGQGHYGFVVYLYGETQPFTITKPRLIDLTKMFQAGNEPSTIEEFNARVATLGIEDMYAYNEGEVIHCNTESIKSVGDNAWDEQWENGTFNTTTGNKVNHEGVNGQIRCKNPIRVLPNEEYYTNVGMWAIFEDSEHNIVSPPSHTGSTSGNSIYISTEEVFITPSDASYMRFYLLPDYGSTYNHDILISLYHSGWKAEKDDQYQPYWQDTLPLPIISKYFPDGMMKAGTAHDEIRFNKATNKWEAVQKIGSVDMGELEWLKLNDSTYSILGTEVTRLNIARNTNVLAPSNVFCKLYASAPTYDIANLDKVIRGPFDTSTYDGQMAIKDSAYTDAASFKASLQGVMLYYELAEPIVTEIAEDFRDYYQVADFGTEMSQSNVPSAAFSADIIYQFNAVDMIREHEAEINELQSIIATMQAQLTSLVNK